MGQVEFITYTADTVWIRDYGPRFVREDEHRAIIDHVYNRPRPRDNAFPDFLAVLWAEPSYDIPLVHGGGNFHMFSDGEAFMTHLILDENPGLTEQDVMAYYDSYQNLDLTILPGFPTSFDSTQHIDMWMLPVDDGVVIIGQYSPSDTQPHTITEAAVTELTARGYIVYRTPGWNAGGTHYTYTNAVVFNDIVFVPEFSGYAAENAQAVAVFEAAFPGHQIMPVDCSQIIHAAGAIHCVVMHVPETTLLPFLDGFESGDMAAWDQVVN
jgi:agmatine/peptidylarginine deiminase